jgi:hypothetical protein
MGTCGSGAQVGQLHQPARRAVPPHHRNRSGEGFLTTRGLSGSVMVLSLL